MEQDEKGDQYIPRYWYQEKYPLEQIIGDQNVVIGTRIIQTQRNQEVHFSSLSTTELITFAESSTDEHWIKAMEEELDQIEKNETWELVPRPNNKSVIGTKWVFKNKKNEDGQLIENKA